MPASFRMILRVTSPLALVADLSACAADALPPPPAPELKVCNFVVLFAFDRFDLEERAAVLRIRIDGTRRVLLFSETLHALAGRRRGLPRRG